MDGNVSVKDGKWSAGVAKAAGPGGLRLLALASAGLAAAVVAGAVAGAALLLAGKADVDAKNLDYTVENVVEAMKAPLPGTLASTDGERWLAGAA